MSSSLIYCLTMEREMVIRSGDTRQLADGTIIRADTRIRAEFEGEASDTATHEATHSVVGEVCDPGTILEATVIRRGNALGTTRTTKPSKAMALAPDEAHMGGTSWDTMVASHLKGSDAASRAVARMITMTYQTEIKAVALSLDAKKTMSGGEIRYTMHNTDLMNENVLFIDRPNGKKEEIVVETSAAYIPISQDIVTFTNPAKTSYDA